MNPRETEHREGELLPQGQEGRRRNEGDQYTELRAGKGRSQQYCPSDFHSLCTEGIM